jgi:peptidoglycan/LPS O-acetylase OafA/YrhL
MNAGYVGVSFFFILSGFILTYSHADEYEAGRGSASKFWVARFARIYPLYFVSMLLAGYVYSSLFEKKIHIIAYIADMLLVQSWSVRLVNFFHVPAWSVSNEAFFYLVFPFVLLRLRPSTAQRALLAITFFWFLALLPPLLCLKFFPVASWSESNAGMAGTLQVFQIRRIPVFALPQFLAGVSLGWLYLRFRPSARAAAWLAGGGIVLLITVLSLSYHLPFVLLHNGLLLPIFSMIILGLCEENIFSRMLSVPLLVLLGEASFALYLLHFMFNDWTKGMGAGETIGSAMWKLAVVIPLSVALHLFLERPGRKLVLRWWSKRHPAQMTVA